MARATVKLKAKTKVGLLGKVHRKKDWKDNSMIKLQNQINFTSVNPK